MNRCSEIDDVNDIKQTPVATATHRRLESIDILRGLALFGVLAVNLVTEFRVSIFAQFLAQPSGSIGLDHAVIDFVHYALELKAFALFSFLFGVGMAMQFERLSGTGKPFYWLTRRLIVLLIFGLIHLLLIWNGDILTEYAVAGLVVLPLLSASRKVLGATAAALLALYIALPLLPLPITLPDHAWITNHLAQANEAYGQGNWLQVTRFSLSELRALLPLHVYIFPRTLCLFILGTLAWRSGVFSRPAKYKAKIISLGCISGIVGVVIAIANGPDIFANLVPIFLALAFAALILAIVEFTPARVLLLPFAAIGRMAFTNYIAQSLIFAWVFFGYGLGQFGGWRPAPTFAFGVAVYIAQVLMSRAWLRHYRFGPIEWFWRTLMYGRLQPMKR